MVIVVFFIIQRLKLKKIVYKSPFLKKTLDNVFFVYIWYENNEWNMILRAGFLFLNRFQPPFEHECAKVRNGVEFSVEADVLVRQFNAELYVAVIFLCNQVV